MNSSVFTVHRIRLDQYWIHGIGGKWKKQQMLTHGLESFINYIFHCICESHLTKTKHLSSLFFTVTLISSRTVRTNLLASFTVVLQDVPQRLKRSFKEFINSIPPHICLNLTKYSYAMGASCMLTPAYFGKECF